MRKMLMAMFLAGGVSAASAAHAAPFASPAVTGPASVRTVQFFEAGGYRDGRDREWRRREAYEHWRRHAEWRREAERRAEWRYGRHHGGYGHERW